MEEIVEKGTKSVVRVILTGPESTGKTMLTMALAEHFKTTYIPEYAREYVEKLNREYTFDDVLHIAQHQVKLMEDSNKEKHFPVFVDTYLIITKVWFLKVFGHYPSWLDFEIAKTNRDLYLLCKTDIPWVDDPVRENGGIMREVLFKNYEEELSAAHLNFAYVEGIGDDRKENALIQINNFLKDR